MSAKSKIEALYDGHPPFSEEELRNTPRGQWLTNLMFENLDLLMPNFDIIEPLMKQTPSQEQQAKELADKAARSCNQASPMCLRPMPLEEQLIRQEVVLSATQEDVRAMQDLRNGSVQQVADLRVQLYDMTMRQSQEREDLFKFTAESSNGIALYCGNTDTRAVLAEVCQRLREAEAQLKVLRDPVPSPGTSLIFKEGEREYTVEYLGEGRSPMNFSGRVTSVNAAANRNIDTDQFPQVGMISDLLDRSRFTVIRRNVPSAWKKGDILISNGGTMKVEYTATGGTSDTFTGVVIESDNEFGPGKGDTFYDLERSKFSRFPTNPPADLEADLYLNMEEREIPREVLEYHEDPSGVQQRINEDREAGGPIFPYQNE